jgi:hypothetical protein
VQEDNSADDLGGFTSMTFTLIALLPVAVAVVSLLFIGGAKRKTGDRPLIHL